MIKKIHVVYIYQNLRLAMIKKINIYVLKIRKNIDATKSVQNVMYFAKK